MVFRKLVVTLAANRYSVLMKLIYSFFYTLEVQQSCRHYHVLYPKYEGFIAIAVLFITVSVISVPH